MNQYAFYIAQIRFVAGKTDRETPAIADMMEDLANFADQIEGGDGIEIPGPRVRSLGRGLAGVAGFLQQHILPETVAAQNRQAEHQVRWVIDTSMALVAGLMVHAETKPESENCPLVLPALPAPCAPAVRSVDKKS